MNFGQYLRKMRKLSGHTSKQLGDAVGTTGQFITQMEQGKLSPPNKEMTLKIAAVIGANPVEIWGIAALERFHGWCKREGIPSGMASTFFQAAEFDRKKAEKRLLLVKVSS